MLVQKALRSADSDKREENLRREKELLDAIAQGHNYIFVGRVGNFVPVKDGTDGGNLYRYKDGKYYYAAGCRGYRWKESEIVRQLDKQDEIDTGYFDDLVNEAKAAIERYGDFEAFFNESEVSNEFDSDIPF